MIVHPIPPVYDSGCRILILGSFPSVQSRADGFFYGHPQNRFWKVISAVLNCETPIDTEQKKSMLLANRIALWDVIASCEITGSSDASISNVTPNDIGAILSVCEINKIFVNGSTAAKLYRRYVLPSVEMEAISLPSTSPANASWNLQRLIEAWRAILG